ncbi:hypothetical protein [Acinetobacter bereziniae]|uniref:hypothetical protein n=1 Tax=Acinetobacter bereziniae TaxID=106648 RepID=UPI0030167615
MKSIVIGFLVLSLAGCSAGVVNQSKKIVGHKLYQDSTENLTSHLRIQQSENFSVRMYPNGCMTSMQPKFLMSPEVENINILGGQIRYKTKLLNMSFPPKDIQFAEFKIPSERFLAFSAYKSYHTGSEMRGCSVNAVYKFATNKNYELLDNSGGIKCSLEINEIMPNGDRVELKPLRYLNNVNEWAGCDAQLKGL